MSTGDYGGKSQNVVTLLRVHLQHALAAEIRGEMASQRITGRQMHKLIGISQASFTNYFVSAKRPVPMEVVARACEVLGVRTSEMLARAEARAARHDEHEQAAERALADLPPDVAEQVRRVDREQRDAREDDSPVTDRRSGVVRSATTGS